VATILIIFLKIEQLTTFSAV